MVADSNIFILYNMPLGTLIKNPSKLDFPPLLWLPLREADCQYVQVLQTPAQPAASVGVGSGTDPRPGTSSHRVTSL